MYRMWPWSRMMPVLWPTLIWYAKNASGWSESKRQGLNSARHIAFNNNEKKTTLCALKKMVLQSKTDEINALVLQREKKMRGNRYIHSHSNVKFNTLLQIGWFCVFSHFIFNQNRWIFPFCPKEVHFSLKKKIVPFKNGVFFVNRVFFRKSSFLKEKSWFGKKIKRKKYQS